MNRAKLQARHCRY